LTTLLIAAYWLTLLLCFSTYFVYPLVIMILGSIFPIRVRKKDWEPDVSILISAYNEELDIVQKIENCLELDYPEDKVEILIGSDGSTDKTVQLARAFNSERVKVLDYTENRGKTSVQNDLVSASKGEILVFTDAASFLNRDAVRYITRNFSDPQIGCVAGRMRFVGSADNINTDSQGLYWRYEVKIREIESSLGRLVGVDGPLYAVRRDCYVFLKPQSISDFLTPLLVMEMGKKVILEPEAVVDEDPTQQSAQELKTRRRITLRGLIGLATYPQVLDPLRNPGLAFSIFFHKVLRWFVGPLVILHVMVCIALAYKTFFALALGGYSVFFAAAFGGWLLEMRGGKNRFLTIPYYFCLVNLAATMGIIDFFRKKQATSWKPVRQ
jgi:cellulose synthase/poly-beta-1,6-N-acetylglucosamine synthase-like glycosyltransferase